MWNDAQADARTATARRRLRILIADDHAGTQQALQLLLQWLECISDVVADGREAVEALQVRDYDLVFMDVVMPRMDGLEATRRIRLMRPFTAGPRIVGMSADATPENHQLCLAVGMDEFLPKPLNVEVLTRILDRVALELVEMY